MPKNMPLGIFGRELENFKATTGYTLKEVAEETHTSYHTLYAARKNDNSGKAVQEIVKAFMRNKRIELHLTG